MIGFMRVTLYEIFDGMVWIVRRIIQCTSTINSKLALFSDKKTMHTVIENEYGPLSR